MTESLHDKFSRRYASAETPWDSGVTPPEIGDLLARRPTGQALDLGCGTGTVIRDLLQAGWRADGVDFVRQALDIAADKLADFPAEDYRLFCHDATRLDDLPALRRDYDLIIDIGCGHAFGGTTMLDYSRAIARRMAPGGLFMLYASHPRPDSTVGWAPKQVERVFGARLDLLWEQRGADRAIGAPASWYKFRNEAR